MSDRTEQLERIARLHAEGALSDEEFAELKRQAIGGVQPRPSRIGLILGLVVGIALLGAGVIWIVADQGSGEGMANEAASSLPATSASSPAPQPTTTIVVPSSAPAVPTTEAAEAATAEELDQIAERLRAAVERPYSVALLSARMWAEQQLDPLWRTQNYDDGQLLACAGREYQQRTGGDLTPRIEREIERVIATVPYEELSRSIPRYADNIEEILGIADDRPDSALGRYSLLVCGGIEPEQARQMAGL
jgi:hypothetical protein